MSNSIAPGSSADVNVRVTALTTNPNVPVTYKTIILKKNLVNGVNTLTQAMMNQANTKYVIKYDYVLGGDITVPENCLLEFDGGSVSGGIIISNRTKVINLPKDTEIVGKIYNPSGSEITIHGDVINRSCKLYYYFNVNNDAYTNKNGNGAYVITTIARNYGITDAIVKIQVKCNSNNMWYTDSYESEESFVNEIRKSGADIYGLKIHSDNANAESIDNYVSFITQIVSKFKQSGLNFKAVWIINEHADMACYNGAFVNNIVPLVNNIHNLGYISRIAFERKKHWVCGANELFIDNVCIPDLNYYPPLSILDKDATFDNKMIQAVIDDIGNIGRIYGGKYKVDECFISETGITKGEKSLRNPSAWRYPDDTGEWNSPEHISIFWTTIINAINKLPFNNIGIWFLEQFPKTLEDEVGKVLYNLFVNVLK